MKQRMRYVVFLLVLGLFATGLSFGITAAAVSGSDTEVPAARVADTGLQASGVQVTASADFAVVYDNLGQLKQDADLVVRGEVTGVEYVDFNTTAHTKIKFKVSKCLLGKVAEGDEITIVEVGGVTTMAVVNGDKFDTPTTKDQETKVEVLLEGAPLSKVGDECMYFLGLGDVGVVDGTYYVPLGAFQGCFKIQNSVAERFVPVDWDGGDYTSLSMDEGALDQAVLQAVQQAK